MATFTPASRLLGVACVCLSVPAAEVQVNVRVGENVTLTCRAPNISFIALKWTRPDLGEEYVLLNRDGHLDAANQHQSFKKRVDLQDRRMKDGDVSLILKDVIINDAGIYECWVFMEETRSWRCICIIRLTAHSSQLSVPEGPAGGLREGGGTEGGVSRGRAGMMATVSLSAVLVVAFLISRKLKEQQSQDPSHPAAELQPV